MLQMLLNAAVMVHSFHVGKQCYCVLLVFSWAQVVCDFRTATTFTTRNDVTLDIMQQPSRDYCSLSLLGSASVLHVTTRNSPNT